MQMHSFRASQQNLSSRILGSINLMVTTKSHVSCDNIGIRMNYYNEKVHLEEENTNNLEDLRQSAAAASTVRKPMLSEAAVEQSKSKKDNSSEDDDKAKTKPKFPQRPIRSSSLALADDTDQSETESDDGAIGGQDVDFDARLTPSKWETLALQQDIKDLFPFILKYTPQNIGTIYHLNPFIPEYVPAVGDVDAFLKVSLPQPLQRDRQSALEEHLQKCGLYFLDEPSGQQSEPSLLHMKLRSVLSGSGSRSKSATHIEIPIAKSTKDIDKWIDEVEAIYRTQSSYKTIPRKDIEQMLTNWPRAYSDASDDIQSAHQRCLQNEISLVDYIQLLCEKFEISKEEDELMESSPLIDKILDVQTLFSLYLAANEAWEC